jgi:hypothetical protein
MNVKRWMNTGDVGGGGRPYLVSRYSSWSSRSIVYDNAVQLTDRLVLTNYA